MRRDKAFYFATHPLYALATSSGSARHSLGNGKGGTEGTRKVICPTTGYGA